MEDYKNRVISTWAFEYGNGYRIPSGKRCCYLQSLCLVISLTQTDSIKRLVAFTAVITAITAWMFSSNGLRIAENAAQDMTAAEAATAAGKNGAGQPWKIYQLYTLAVTIASIVITLTAIY